MKSKIHQITFFSRETSLKYFQSNSPLTEINVSIFKMIHSLNQWF